MEPQIRYAKTNDRMNIAYFAWGEGVPFVRMPNAPFDHIQLHYASWGRSWCDAIASRMRLIRYDARGCGMSTRDVAEFSLETFIEDLRSVVDTLEIERFVLESQSGLAPAALAFAAQHPARVSHLIIHSGTARNTELWSRRAQSTHAMLTNAPDVYAAAVAGMLYGSGTDSARVMAEFIPQSCDGRAARRMLDAEYRLDVSSMLADVSAPALIMCSENDTVYNREAITKLAAAIGGAMTVLQRAPTTIEDVAMHGASETLAFLTDQGVIAGRAPAEVRSTQAGAPSASAFRTVLFTDIVGHTEMMNRLGDAKGRDVLREHERITRETLKAHGGAEVKTMGDGFMASFGSVTSAMGCAIALQRAFATHTESMPEPLHVRVGLNAGEPIEEDGDLFGATVILASRIAAKAGAGEILVPDTVRGLLSGKGFVFGDRGEFVPKGFDEGVRLWDVRWTE